MGTTHLVRWAYRTVRVTRTPEGVDVVTGDSTGDPRTHGRENAHLALYLNELGTQGWEVCGVFGATEAHSPTTATILLKQPNL